MPQAGDIKWTRNNTLMTPDAISDAIGIATNNLNWVNGVINDLMIGGIVANYLVALPIACGLVGSIYFSNYRDELYELFLNVKELVDSNETFYVAQRYRWHAGHRSWQPQNIFKVVVVDSNGNVIREIL